MDARKKEIEELARWVKNIHDGAIREGMRMQRQGETEAPAINWTRAVGITMANSGWVFVDPALVEKLRATTGQDYSDVFDTYEALADAVLEQLTPER